MFKAFSRAVAVPYITLLFSKKFSNKSGRPVIIQRRKCISKATPLPPEPKPIKPGISETILLNRE